MKLDLDPSPSYLLPVAIPVRLADGSLKAITVRFRVKRLDQDDYAELLERYTTAVSGNNPELLARVKKALEGGNLQAAIEQISDEDKAEVLKAPMRPVDAMRKELREVVTGWEDADFNPATPFSPEAFEKVLAMPGASQAIFYKHGDSIPVAKRGNL